MDIHGKQFTRIALLGLSLVFVPAVAQAQGGLEKTAQVSGLSNYGSDPLLIAGNVISSLLAMTSVFFFILMIYAGFKWMLSRGNDEAVSKAKHTISAAIIGVIIIFASYAITRLVMNASSGNPSGLPGSNDGSSQQQASCVPSQASKEEFASTDFVCGSLSAGTCETPQTVDCVFLVDSLGGTCVATQATKQKYPNSDSFCSQFSQQVPCEEPHAIQCILLEP